MKDGMMIGLHPCAGMPTEDEQADSIFCQKEELAKQLRQLQWDRMEFSEIAAELIRKEQELNEKTLEAFDRQIARWQQKVISLTEWLSEHGRED